MTDTIDVPDATWTVTSEQRRRFLRAYWLWWWRQPSIWLVLCGAVGVVIGAVVVLDVYPAVVIVFLLVDLAVFAAFSVWRVRRIYPLGETFRSWADVTAYRLEGPGVGMEINWSRITAVNVGPVATHLRTRTPKQNLLVAGQVLGEQARARLARGVGEGDSEPVAREDVPGERSVVVDRQLQIALGLAAARQFRVTGWFLVTVMVLMVLLAMAGSDPWPTMWMVGVLMLGLGAVVLTVVAPTIGSYPVGSTIRGHMGESLVVHGPWGRTSIHRSKLKLVATTKHAIAFKSGPTWVVVPRAILDEK